MPGFSTTVVTEYSGRGGYGRVRKHRQGGDVIIESEEGREVYI